MNFYKQKKNSRISLGSTLIGDVAEDFPLSKSHRLSRRLLSTPTMPRLSFYKIDLTERDGENFSLIIRSFDFSQKSQQRLRVSSTSDSCTMGLATSDAWFTAHYRFHTWHYIERSAIWLFTYERWGKKNHSPRCAREGWSLFDWLVTEATTIWRHGLVSN